MSQYTDNSTNLSNNTNSFNVQNNYVVADERSQLLAWLSPLEPKLRHRDIQERRVDNVGEWLLQTEEFRRWNSWSSEYEGDKAVLFCYGGPGVGKTFISSLVVDRLCDQARGKNTAVACFYFDFAARKEQSAGNMLGSLLKQVVGGMGKIPEEVLGAFQDQKSVIGGRAPRLPDIVKASILEKIPQNMSEMFLLVSLNIDAILHEPTISGRREKLSKMADGLELRDVYGATIERIRAQDGGKSRLGMTALMWISHAERPLLADELCHALAVQLDSTDFDIGKVPSMSTLLSCCQGLITVDKEASTVRLVHFTLQEYLSSHRDIFSRPHSAIAEICLTYLNSQQVKALPTAPSRDTQNPPFLEYCSIYWGIHAKRELSDYGRSLALRVLKRDYGQISTKLLLMRVKHFRCWLFDTLSPLGGLHCASLFGIVEVVAGLIEMEYYDINQEDFSRGGPLAWAARNGHEGVVKYLLGREGVEPDMADKYGGTPLSFAAENGHEEVVKILLGREEVNPDKPDDDDRTPLSFAAVNGHEGVVKILLGREEVNPDKPNYDGRTPLSFAAVNGHEGVVKILLGREEVNPDKVDEWGQTPLFDAARNGHAGVVKILLGREEVNPDKPDNSGQTPLSYAALYGHEGVVEILLQREEVNPHRPDNDLQPPLWYAAWSGHERVVTLLQSRKTVTPSAT